jgi:hypothetical protein
MGEFEYDRLLDAVRTAIAPVPGEDTVLADLLSIRPPIRGTLAKAANDNGPTWPAIPFPDGWNAVC